MVAKWRVIDCSTFAGTLRAERGAIFVQPADDDQIRVPLADVAVLLLGMQANVSAAALHRLMEQDVAVLICDWRGVPEGAVYAWSEHGRVGARARAQAALSVPRAKNAWSRIVKAKISGQAQTLEQLGIAEAGELRRLAGKVRSGDPQNLEGQAAKIYWPLLAGSADFRRIGQGANDDFNSCLNYAYSILRGHGIRAVLSAGLTPALSVFHRHRANNFALVDDLIEPFRPAIDAGISVMSSHDINSKQVRADLVALAGSKFLASGTTIPGVFNEFAQQYGVYVESEVGFLDPPIWRGV